MPTYRPPDWQQNRPPDWRWAPEWYILAAAIAIVAGLVVIIIIDGKGL